MNPANISGGAVVRLQTILRMALVVGLIGIMACGNDAPGMHDEDDDCSEGALSCDCYPNQTCDVGLICGANDLCQTAEDADCPQGSLDCPCYGNYTCDAGLACNQFGVCQPTATYNPVLPENPRCYTPCRDGYTRADNTYVPCPANRLMPGCIGGTVCLEGSCVKPESVISVSPLVGTHGAAGGGIFWNPTTLEGEADAESTSTCNTDMECPHFQTCIAGRCYSNCEINSDCADDLECHFYVCRQRCTVETARSCPAGTDCVNVDGTNGFCLMKSPRNAETEEKQMLGTFFIDRTHLEYSSLVLEHTVELTNNTPEQVTYTITKVRHSEFSDTGETIVETNPLHWIEIRADDDSTVGTSLDVTVQAFSAMTLEFVDTENTSLERWTGQIRISNERLGIRRLYLQREANPKGRWTGQMYSFANFGSRGLEEWRRNKTDPTAIQRVGNAFIKRWIALKQGRITLDEFRALMSATNEETWKWGSVQSRCPNPASPSASAGCYLYDNPDVEGDSGVVLYSSDLKYFPIPSAVTALPVAMNIQPEAGAGIGHWTGRIESSVALQYAGNPQVTLTFQDDPTTCATSVRGACIVPLVDTSARPGFLVRSVVGGRYLTDPTDSSCNRTAAGDYMLTSTPWLVPGFAGEGIFYSPATGWNHRYECRDRRQPFASAADTPKNLSLAMSNPVPDGRSRSRVIRMVDGAMFNQDTLIIIYEERFASFLSDNPSDDFSAFGYMLLTRSPLELSASEYMGSDQSDFRPQPDVLGMTCDSELLSQVADAVESENMARSTVIRNGTFRNQGVTNVQALASLVQVLLNGRTESSTPEEYDPTEEAIHYFCEDTGLFDGGRNGNTPCPVGSRVEFFALRDGAVLPDGATWQNLRSLSCQENTLQFLYPRDVGNLPDGVEDPEATQVLLKEGGQKGTCGQVLEQWRHDWRIDPASGNARFGVFWECDSAVGESAYCDFNRYNLREGKRFFAEGEEAMVFTGLRYAIREAFAYRTKFQNRSGTSLAFTPVICGSPEDTAGYCFDPDAINELIQRVDCAVHVYTEYYEDLATEGTVRGDLLTYLQQNFAYASEPYSPVIHDGFEKLYAELLTMLGDEAYTQSFASRFDLAGTRISTFNGGDFEPGGITLSGGAGFEMAKLYEATQYFQLALDRLYGMGPSLYAALEEGKGDFITQATVVTWFSKLIQASGQKSRAFSRIATRYQGFNRPDLSRAVIERGYVAAYMELVILSELMLEVVSIAEEESRAQIISTLETAQLRFRQGLLEMRDVYQSITNEVNYFGYPADFVPFPMVDPDDITADAASYLIEWAKDMATIAAGKEDLALESSRQFDTNAALFMAELNAISVSFDDQLENICGMFEGDDGDLYPAVPENAEMSQPTLLMQQVMGTPCGWVGTGELYEAMMELGKSKIEMDQVVVAQDNLIAEINIELERVSSQCDEIVSLKDITLSNARGITNLETTIYGIEQTIDIARRSADIVGHFSSIAASGDVWTKAGSIALSATYGVAAALVEVGAVIGSVIIGSLNRDIADLEQATVEAEFDSQCVLARIDSLAVIKNIVLGMKNLELEAMKIQYDVQLGMSRVQNLRNQVRDIMDDKETAQQMLIDVAAAYNNPNTRIYKNDAVITADRTFQRALASAYEATKIFEYYTSQSYAYADSLFLVRLVQYGEFSLEAYIEGLEDAYYSFTYDYGIPDERVAVLSLRDDVLKVPYIDGDALSLSTEDRIAMFRERLLDPNFIDPDGYRAYPFATSLNRLSPLTRNHKVRRMQVEMIGSDTGDDVGRVYLRQKGTGVVHGVDNEKSYYSFPERTAVVNAFFNGQKPFYQSSKRDVYDSWRFKDRPFVNTQWEVLINQKDEHENMDIDLGGLSDIRLFIYYSDFTVF